MNRLARKWEQAVDCSCISALKASGFDEPEAIRTAKVAELLIVPEVDLENVASLLSFFYTEDNKWRELIDHEPIFNITEEELASDINAICDLYDYDQHPEWLAAISVKDFLELEGIDEVTIPAMLRKIYHILDGMVEPDEMPPVTFRHRWETESSTEEDREEDPCDISVSPLLLPDRIVV